MRGILYFSSTGNTLFIAEQVKKELGGQIIYLPKYQGNASEFDSVILVTPIYSFGMPKHVYEFLPKMDKTKELIVIQNYGGMTGGADYFMLKYCQELGLNIKSVYVMKMPENFTVTFTVPKFYINSILKKSRKKVQIIIEKIKNHDHSLPKHKKTKEATYLKNLNNWHKIADDFSVNENCIKCGKCVNLCPAKNIKLENGKIVFGDKCVACLGCYHRCPQKAIQYKGRKKKDRYINPNIDENDIGKNL